MILLHRNLYNDWLNLTPDDILNINYNLKDRDFIAYDHIHKFIKFAVKKLNHHLNGNELSLIPAIDIASVSYTDENSNYKPIKSYRDYLYWDQNAEITRKQKYNWAETDLPQLNQLFLKVYYNLNDQQLCACNDIDSHNGKKRAKDVIINYFFNLSMHYHENNVKFIFPIAALANFINNYYYHGDFVNHYIYDDKYTFIINSNTDLNEFVDLLLAHYDFIKDKPTNYWQHCILKIDIDQKTFLDYIKQFQSYHNDVINKITNILWEIYNDRY